MALQPEISHLLYTQEKTSSSVYRLPLGLLMLSRGLIDENELSRALRMKADSPVMRVGECLSRLGLVNEEQVTRSLALQNGLPAWLKYRPKIERAVPLRLQEIAEVYCFRVANRSVLYAGFGGCADSSFLRAVESVLGVPVEACIIPSRIVLDRLAALAELGSPNEIVFESHMLSSEIADSICSYAKQVSAESIRLVNARWYLWVRLSGSVDHDLLFRLPSA